MESAEMESKRVGVFTRIYRNDDTMHEAIQSVLNQTYSNFKFYIMVNETTKKIILEWAKKDSRIKLIDGGINDGFKTCAKEIASENLYVTTIDADDWYDVNYLADLIEQIENKKVDMVACGNYYFTGKNHIVGERKQGAMTWEKSKTSQVLPFIYGHFRTIWGKLITAELLLRSEFNSLPDSTKYGGYGGDTLFMFNLLSYANRIAITDKSLYYYRVSESSGTYRLNPGRLDADEIVFEYVENVLKGIGPFGDNQRRYLFWIYGNALIDTARLILNMQQLSVQEKLEKIKYIFQKELTKELFFRETVGTLEINELGSNKNYAVEVYQLLFSNIQQNTFSLEVSKMYFEVLEIIYPKLNGIISVEEFCLLSKSKKLLDAFVMGKMQQVFEMLLVILKVLNKDEAKCCLKLMRRLTSDLILKTVLQEDFVKGYPEVIRLLNNGKYEEACLAIKQYFSGDMLPDMAEELLTLWNNLAAQLENVSDFVLSKQIRVELYIRLNKTLDAINEFRELKEEMHICDENMIYLEECINNQG